jgi:hypothetical protein
MFRELLESNGFNIHTQEHTYFIDKKGKFENKILYVMVDELLDNGNAISFIQNYGEFIKEPQAIEQACMQYCIENGVRLEWIIGLNEKMYFHNGNSICWRHDLDKPQLGTFAMIKDGLLENVSMYYGKNDENYVYITKLIAAIYAHDIKIIEGGE